MLTKIGSYLNRHLFGVGVFFVLVFLSVGIQYTNTIHYIDSFNVSFEKPGKVLGAVLENKIVIAGDASEVSGITNGGVVTPSASINGIRGTLVMTGSGTPVYSAMQVGNGVAFTKGSQQNTNSSYYKFIGREVGEIFNASEGEIEFYLKSAYDLAERPLLTPGITTRNVFEVKDDSKTVFQLKTQLFNSNTQIAFAFKTAATADATYAIPAVDSDRLFGKGKTVKIKIAWNGTQNFFYLNDVLVKTANYTAAQPNWNSLANFTFGAFTTGFFASDDSIDEFTVRGPIIPADVTAPSAPVLSGTVLSGSQEQLTWSAAQDNAGGSGVAGYNVYRNGSLIYTSPAAVLSYIDSGLNSGTSYKFEVTAYDFKNNESAKSNPVNVTGGGQSGPLNPVVEWIPLGSQPLRTTTGGSFGSTGVTTEVRSANTASGVRYDVRLRNRTATTYTHTALRVILPRAGSDTKAVIDGMNVNIPAEVYQGWTTPASTDRNCWGPLFGMYYEINSNGSQVKKVGPPVGSPCLPGVQMVGRTNGIVRVDGKTYVIPEFWERQPRRITVNQNEIVLTFFEGSEPLRAGEDAWDQFGIFNSASISDNQAVTEVENLPLLSPAQRQALMNKLTISSEGLSGLVTDPAEKALLDRYDQWQGTPWDKSYATTMFSRTWYGEPNPDKTTLWSLFGRGMYQPVNTGPLSYSWRSYGDIQWSDGYSGGHYDWIRAALKRYLRTGDTNALRWGMAAIRHAITVDFVWTGPKAGIAQYEKGYHGDNAPAPAAASHTWDEGLWLATDMSSDPWIREAALKRVDFAYNEINKYTGYVMRTDGALRLITWPMLILVRGYEYTGDIKYWNMATRVMDGLLEQERLSGGKGFMTNISGTGTGPYNAFVLHHGYMIRALLAYADRANQMGVWTTQYDNFVERLGTWASTPMPNGPYWTSAQSGDPYGSFRVYWCDPSDTRCVAYRAEGDADKSYNLHYADLFAWLAQKNPTKWKPFFKQVFNDFTYNAVANNLSNVGYLTNNYAGTETKMLGWIQLFGDRSALYLAGKNPSVFGSGTPTPPPPANDTTPPTFSSVTSTSVTNNAATVSWTTNELSDTQVEYGTSTSYGLSTTLNTSMVTSHSAGLSGLLAGTTYNYRVKSRDAAGNLGVSTNQTFTTTGTPTPVNQKPTGNFDGIDLTAGKIFGWAQDSDNLSAPVNVHIYIDKNAGTAGANPVILSASDFRSDVQNHSFNYFIPAGSPLRDNLPHQVWVWAIDLTDTSGANNVQLSGSPKSFTLAVIPPPTAGAQRKILIDLDGISSNKVANGTISFVNLTTKTVVNQISFTTNSLGEYTFAIPASLPVGAGIRISVSGYLSRLLTNADLTTSSLQTITIPMLLAGDFNGDGIINSLDFSLLSKKWNQTTNLQTQDINRDGIVNSLDYAILYKNWFMVGQ